MNYLKRRFELVDLGYKVNVVTIPKYLSRPNFPGGELKGVHRLVDGTLHFDSHKDVGRDVREIVARRFAERSVVNEGIRSGLVEGSQQVSSHNLLSSITDALGIR